MSGATANAMNAPQDFNEARVQGLLERIRDYEAYFSDMEGQGDGRKDVGRLDHQATTAYINLVKLVCSLKENEPEEKSDPEAVSEAARRVFREEYGLDL